MNDASPSGSSPNVVPEQAAGDAAYRGFLFADLRGYTAFVEAHGATAAADLLDAYRLMVREQVANHAGAEIRTEGDSFYVVFSSARHAVACGLAIIAAAAELTRANPERPIRVGIGINAGETVQREEGYVGTAVNLAARVCSAAREGEVLVTSAVMDAVGAGANVHFEARGTRRLKGIARPVPLFAARPADAPGNASRPLRPSPIWAVAALGATAVGLAAIAYVAGWYGVSPDATGATRPSSAASTPAAMSAGASPSESSPAAVMDADAQRAAVEAELSAMLGEDGQYCERANEDDLPTFRIDRLTAQAFNVPVRPPLEISGGVACEVPSIATPDVIYLWGTRGTLDYRDAQVGEALINNTAGALGIPRGDCQEPNVVVAHGKWRVGDLGGWLLCREVFGDAIIEWSYDGQAIYAQAIRRDGDHQALMDWWRDEARLISP